MSILNYFRPVKQKLDLPDPSGPLSKLPSTAIASANVKVLAALEDGEEMKKKVSRGPYLSLTPAQKYEIGKRAAEHGVTASIRLYKKKYPHLSLKETTVRRLKNSYKEYIKVAPAAQASVSLKNGDKEAFVHELPSKKVGRPLMTGDETDKQVQHYITELRKRGCIINTTVAIAVGEGILLNKDANLLAANGGGINLTKDWAKYLFRRMGLVKRKGNTKAKVELEQFDEIKRMFHQDIRSAVVMDEVPSELVINWDQTALSYVPVSQWTMEEEGAKRVEIDGKDDKRQITAVFGCSLTGDFLPLQLIYQGKTTKCLPQVRFPSDWSVVYTANHWSNEETMEVYITKIIMPYIAETKRKFSIPLNHPALLLFDNFKGQCTEKLLKLLDSNNIDVVLIPPNCTDRLQPLDLSVNKAAKEFLRRKFQNWYATKVCAQLDGKEEKEAIDLRLSIMKPLGAKWVIELYDHLKGKPDVIKNGFKEAGIFDCVKV